MGAAGRWLTSCSPRHVFVHGLPLCSWAGSATGRSWPVRPGRPRAASLRSIRHRQGVHRFAELLLRGMEEPRGRCQERAQAPGAIGYVNQAYERGAIRAAALQNREGRFVMADARSGSNCNPTGADSFPIVSFTWIRPTSRARGARRPRRCSPFSTGPSSRPPSARQRTRLCAPAGARCSARQGPQSPPSATEPEGLRA